MPHTCNIQMSFAILPLCHLQAISILFASKVAFINVRNFEGSECRSLILPFYLFGVSQYNERQSSVWVITGPNNVIHYIMGFLTWLERWMGLGWGVVLVLERTKILYTLNQQTTNNISLHLQQHHIIFLLSLFTVSPL